MNKSAFTAHTAYIGGGNVKKADLRLNIKEVKEKRQSLSLTSRFLKIKKLRDPFSPTFTEVETPQVTPSKLPYGTRKHPLSAATFPS